MQNLVARQSSDSPYLFYCINPNNRWEHYINTVFKIRFKLPRIPDGLYEVRPESKEDKSTMLGMRPDRHSPHTNLTTPLLHPPSCACIKHQPIKVANVGDYDLRYLSVMTAESGRPCEEASVCVMTQAHDSHAK